MTCLRYWSASIRAAAHEESPTRHQCPGRRRSRQAGPARRIELGEEPLVLLIRVPQLGAGKIVQRLDRFDTLPTGLLFDRHMVIGRPWSQRLGTRHSDHLSDWLFPDRPAIKCREWTAAESNDDSSSQGWALRTAPSKHRPGTGNTVER